MSYVVGRRHLHFMNSALDRPGVFSCAVDAFLEIYKKILFKSLKDLAEPSPFILLTNTCITHIQNCLNSEMPAVEIKINFDYVREGV